jgi:5-methylcytosine-specific restriction endonuclease McrA
MTEEEKKEAKREKRRLAAKKRRDANPEKSRESSKRSAAKRKAKDPVAFNKKKNDKRQELRRSRGVKPLGWNKLPPEERKRRDRAAALAWQLAHPEEYKESQKRSKAKNAEKNRQQHREWCRRNPNKVREYNLRAKHKRRMKLENQPDVDIIVWRETLELFEYRCAYCLDWATSLDHILAIENGGTNDPDNCIPACKRCNSSKGKKYIDVWLKTARIAKEALSRPFDYQPPELLPKMKVPKKAA